MPTHGKRSTSDSHGKRRRDPTIRISQELRDRFQDDAEQHGNDLKKHAERVLRDYLLHQEGSKILEAICSVFGQCSAWADRSIRDGVKTTMIEIDYDLFDKLVETADRTGRPRRISIDLILDVVDSVRRYRTPKSDSRQMKFRFRDN